jgi:DNA repair exonuclease SbcCD ATPase subunit
MLPYGPEENGREWTDKVPINPPSPPAIPAPSQPVVLPPLDRTIEDKKRADTEFSHALRENQQLRQRIDEFSTIYAKCASDLEKEFERAENLQQQLAQIRSAEVPDFDWDKMEAIAQDELCPECEGQEYCAACLAIKGTRWALKMKQTIAALRLDNAQKDKRIAELEGATK